jgi:hypothetical protein
LQSISDTRNYTKKRPIGLWDGNIFCFECDAFLGRLYDEPAKEAILNSDLKTIKELEDGKVRILPNVDPVMLKNFLISTLFRAAVSTTEEFINFHLPDKFLARMREILCENVETSCDEFQTFILKSRAKDPQLEQVAEKFFAAPYPTRIGPINYVVQNLPKGYQAYLKVDQRYAEDEFSAFSLRKNYPILILEWENFEESLEFNALANCVINVGVKNIKLR